MVSKQTYSRRWEKNTVRGLCHQDHIPRKKSARNLCTKTAQTQELAAFFSKTLSPLRDLVMWDELGD